MTHQRPSRRSTPDGDPAARSGMQPAGARPTFVLFAVLLGPIAIAGIVLVATRPDNTAHTARRLSVAQHVRTPSTLRTLSPGSSLASSGTDDSLAASATDCSLPADDQWGAT